MTEPMEIEEQELSLPQRQPPVARELFPADRLPRRTTAFRNLDDFVSRWAVIVERERAIAARERGL